MHPTWGITEIVGQILLYIKHDNRALLSLTRTNHLLSHEALALLWESLDSIIPLLQLFPVDAISINTNSSGKREIVIPRALCNSDWDRFDIYAPLVRKIQNQILGGPYSRILEWGRLRVYRRDANRGLLPNLRYLNWSFYCREDCFAFCSTLGPTVTSIQLHLTVSRSEHLGSPDFVHMIEEIQQLSPGLTDLRCIGFINYEEEGAPNAALLDSSLKLVQSQSALCSLTIDQELFTSMLPSLRPLFQLETLEFDARGLFRELEQSDFISAPALLPAVRIMKGDIDWGGKRFWCMFLPFIGHLLTTIELGNDRENQILASEAVELTACIGSSCPYMETLIISYMAHNGEEPSSLSGMFRGLLQCTMLAKVEISLSTFDICLTLTDADIKDMSLAWKRLEILHLSAIYVGDGVVRMRSTLTLDAIAILCHHCPRLRSLELTVDASTCPPILLIRTSGALQYLQLGRSRVGDFCEVAGWLGNICFAGSLFFSRGTVESEQWGNVEKVMRALELARSVKEEEMRAELVELKKRVAQLETVVQDLQLKQGV